MALIPPFFLDCIVAIGTLNDKDEKEWIATGFLFGKFLTISTDDKKEKLYTLYLVTNRHVLEKLKIIFLRFNPQTDQSAKDYKELIVDKEDKPIWVGHPNPDVDVAVISIEPQVLNKEGMKFAFFTSDDLVFTKEQMRTIQVTEGDFVYVLGFPMGIIGEDRQHVILRSGVIARISDFFESRSLDYIIDAVVFPGNSGGPVILKPEVIAIEGTNSNSRACLIGLIKSYLPYRDVAVSLQTKKPRIIFEENSGLSLVEPVDNILETITAYEQKQTAALRSA